MVPVIFSPSVGGLVSGGVTVSSGSLGVGGVLVPVTGTGVVAPALTLSPRTLSFGSSPIGVRSAGQAIEVTNPGGVGLAGLTLKVVGSAVSDFAIGATNCAGGLGAGASCSVLVSFAPTVQGGRTAFLTASSTTAGVASESTSLSGVGLSAALLTTAPGTLTFKPTLVGQVSGTQMVTISNAGQTGVMDLTLGVSAGFAIDATHTTCTRLLAAGAGCQAGVMFSPTIAGTDVGTLVADSASADLEGSVAATTSLNGVGALPPGIVTSPAAAVLFGVTGIHLPATPIVVTVMNQSTTSGLGGLSIVIDSVGLAAGFYRSGGTCGNSLGAGASCTVIVIFKPTQAGNASGSLLLKGTNGGSSASLALSGVGYDFTMTLVGSGSVSVIPGQTAYYMVAITPLAGTSAALGGSFELGCKGLPANALCVFNPPLLAALPAGISGDVTMGVGTGGPVIQRSLLLRRDGRGVVKLGPGVRGGGNLLAILGLTIVPMAWRRRRRNEQHPMQGILIFLLALPAIVAGVSSCVGASGSGGQLHGTGGTPIGSYTVQMTASSTGVAHSVPMTLIVN